METLGTLLDILVAPGDAWRRLATRPAWGAPLTVSGLMVALPGLMFAPLSTRAFVFGAVVFTLMVGWHVVIGTLVYGTGRWIAHPLTLRDALAVTCSAAIIPALGSVVARAVHAAGSSASAPTSLLIVLPLRDSTGWVVHLVNGVDLFSVWWLVVLSLGIARLLSVRTVSVATVAFALYGVAVVAKAGIKVLVGAQV